MTDKSIGPSEENYNSQHEENIENMVNMKIGVSDTTTNETTISAGGCVGGGGGGGEKTGATAITDSSNNPENNTEVNNDNNKNGTSSVSGIIEELKKLHTVTVPSTESCVGYARKPYKFWSTQPVPKLDEVIQANEPIEADKKISEIRQEPYALPDGFKWDIINLSDSLILAELYTLLNENYVEDDDAMFRFDYQPNFLRWALQPPGWKMEWHVGVRVVKSGRLVGFISAIPGNIRIIDKHEKIVEINFLCVHKKLRSKRVAPVLIKEITRRVNLVGIFQAVYTAGVVLPKPVSTCRYWHRSLNPRKLIEIKFSHLSRNMTMQRTMKLYKLPETLKTSGFRIMRESDIPNAHKLLEQFLSKYKLVPVFTEEEFEHWFLTRTDIVNSYVVDDGNGEITDFVSYYTLPSTVMHHAVHKSVKAAYSFYNVSTKTEWIDLMTDALITAKNSNFDVFNALDLMDNKKFLIPLKFGIGDGNLQYYLYNWRCPAMTPQDIGLILL